MKITVPHGVAARDELAASLGQRKSVTFFVKLFSQGNARDGVECAWRLATCFGYFFCTQDVVPRTLKHRVAGGIWRVWFVSI